MDSEDSQVLSVRIPAKLKADMDAAAKEAQLTLSQHALRKLQGPDLPPYLTELLGKYAKGLGMDPGALRCRILAAFFAHRHAHARVWGGSEVLVELVNAGMEGADFYAWLCQHYVKGETENKRQDLREKRAANVALTAAEETWLSSEHRAKPRQLEAQAADAEPADPTWTSEIDPSELAGGGD